jgi:MerR family transcriptional regulator/heat shock protein HspR
VQKLSQDEGVNLAGIKRIIGLEHLVGDLQQQVAELEAALDAAYQRIAQLEALTPYPGSELLPTTRTSNALVVWRPRQK